MTKVKQFLEFVPDEVEVYLNVNAYGCIWASSYQDGMLKAGELKQNLNYDCMNSYVVRVQCVGSRLLLTSEIVKDFVRCYSV